MLVHKGASSDPMSVIMMQQNIDDILVSIDVQQKLQTKATGTSRS